MTCRKWRGCVTETRVGQNIRSGCRHWESSKWHWPYDEKNVAPHNFSAILCTESNLCK